MEKWDWRSWYSRGCCLFSAIAAAVLALLNLCLTVFYVRAGSPGWKWLALLTLLTLAAAAVWWRAWAVYVPPEGRQRKGRP